MKFKDYRMQIGGKAGAQNGKILPCSDQCAAYSKNTFLTHTHIRVLFLPANCISQLQLLDLGIIHAIKCSYGKNSVQKTVAMIDGRLLQDA
jgi:hypothetical protein